MELQIQDLVTSIREEGLNKANEEANAIISSAKKEADNIISKAKKEAQAELDAMKKEIEILKENAKLSAEQAKRDAMISFKDEVKKEFEKILSNDIKKDLSGANLSKLIQLVVAGEDVSKYEVEVNSVTDTLKAELKQEVENGLSIKVGKGMNSGFKLKAKDGSGYFDCSDEEITKMLMPYFRNLDF